MHTLHTKLVFHFVHKIICPSISGVPGIPRQGGQAAASIHFSDGGGGVKVRKMPNSRAKSQYLTFPAKRAAKMKIVYV